MSAAANFPPDLLNDGRYILGVNASSYRIRRYFMDEKALAFNVDTSGRPGMQWSNRGRVCCARAWNGRSRQNEAESSWSKNLLGELPFTAELYWMLRQPRQKAFSRFNLDALKDHLPEMVAEVAPHTAIGNARQEGFFFASMHYWIIHTTLTAWPCAAWVTMSPLATCPMAIMISRSTDLTCAGRICMPATF